MKRTVSLCVASVLIILVAIATVHAGAIPTAQIPPTDAASTIDGQIQEEWAQCAAVTGFSQVGLNRLADEQTTAFVTWDDTALYVAFRCMQEDSPIVHDPNGGRDSAVYKDDSVEIFLQPRLSAHTYYHFAGNTAGQVRDEKGRDVNWNADWEYAATGSDGSWEAEFAIPWAEVGCEASEGAQIGINLGRARQSATTVYSSWSPVMRSFHDPATFARVTLADVPAIRVSLPEDTRPGALVDVLNVTDTAVSASADVQIVPELTSPLQSREQGEIAPADMLSAAQAADDEPGRYEVKILVEADGNALLSQSWRQDVPYPMHAELRRYFFHDEVVPVCYIPEEEAGDTTVTFTLLAGEEALQRVKVGPDDPVRPAHDPREHDGLGKRVSAVLDISEAPVGSCAVRIAADGPDETQAATIPFQKPADSPWLDCDYGTEDRLLEPWTPMQVQGQSVACWGRQYRYADTGLPEQIMNQGSEMLAEPVRLRGRINGELITWQPEHFDITDHTETQAIIEASSATGDADLAVRTELEFDGLAWTDLELSAQGQQLDELALEIPVRKEVATLFFGQPMDRQIGKGKPYPSWSGTPNGAMTQEPASGPFTNYIWFGNEDMGLVWCCESPQYWANSDPDEAIEIIPRDDHVVLRINFVDRPLQLSDALKLSFGLQATPVKKTRERVRIRTQNYGDEKRKRWVEESGSLVYPAAGNIDAGSGSLHVWTELNFDPHVKPQPNVGRADYNRDLFFIRWPNGDGLGFYWNIDDRGLRAWVREGPPELNNYIATLQTHQPEWQDGQEHLLSLSWGEKLAIYVDGKCVGTRDFQGIRPTPLEDAKLQFGGRQGSGFLLDAVKISDAEYTGGTLPKPTADDNTLLLDTLEARQNPHHTDPVKAGGTPHAGELRDTFEIIEGPMGDRLKLGTRPEMVSHLEMQKRRGVDYVWLHEQWTETEGYPMTREYRENLHSFVRGAHEAGLKVLLYLGCEIGDNCEEYRLYRDEIVVEPWIEGYGYKRSKPPQVAYDCAYVGPWQNFMLYHLRALIREFDIDGFYLDGTFMPYSDMNRNHGAGYIHRDGELGPSFQIRKMRRWIKRLRTMAEEEKVGFWIDMHDSSGILTPTNSFGDSIWNGEQYVPVMRSQGITFRDCLSPDTFRTTFLGTQYGFPTDFLAYEHLQEAHALALVHGIPVRRAQDREVTEALQRFGIDEAAWHPYWDNGNLLHVSGSEDIYASFYQRDDGAVLLLISNLGKNEATATLQFDADALPSPVRGPVTDATSGVQVGETDGTLELELEPWKLYMRQIGGV
ncbi:MAG: DUF6067 family protein [Armatimonadota bacterium]